MGPNTHTHNNNGIRYNTSYYRRNKNKRFCVHKCQHCNYETTGPKQALRAHIWSKHTPEYERPFQCPCPDCNRGFASKANLLKHIEKYHNIKIPKHNKKILTFGIVSINKNTQRTRTYNDIKFILVEKLPENITLIDLYYDIYSKTISVKSYTREYLKKIYNASTYINSP